MDNDLGDSREYLKGNTGGYFFMQFIEIKEYK
jgi:hypothetical protein